MDAKLVAKFLCNAAIMGYNRTVIYLYQQYPKTYKEIKHTNKILIWDKMLSHTRMGVPYDSEYTYAYGTSHSRMGQYTHMGQNCYVKLNCRMTNLSVSFL